MPPLLASSTRAPSAINAGIESPIGEPLATLPPSVPLARIGGDAKRIHASCNSGYAVSSAANAAASDAPAPIDQPAAVRSIALQRLDVADVDDVAQHALLLRHPQGDIRGAGHDACRGLRGTRRDERVHAARRAPALCVGRVIERVVSGERCERLDERGLRAAAPAAFACDGARQSSGGGSACIACAASRIGR